MQNHSKEISSFQRRERVQTTRGESMRGRGGNSSQVETWASGDCQAYRLAASVEADSDLLLADLPGSVDG